MSKCNSSKGFTLIELMIVLGVAALVITLGIPSFQEIIRSNRFAAQTNAFVSSMNLARSVAITRGVRVTLCKSSNGQECTTEGGYEQGWIVFTDVNNAGGDKVGSLDTSGSSQDQIVRVVSKLPGGVPVDDNGNKELTLTAVTGKVKNFISYMPDGTTKTASGSFQNGTIKLCQKDIEEGRRIIINKVGRARSANATCP